MTTTDRHTTARTAPRRRRVVHVAIYIVFLVALAWIGVRLAMRIRFGVPVTEHSNLEHVWRKFYPELGLSGVFDAQIAPDDGVADIVLLGASTLGQLQKGLEADLRNRLKQPVRVYPLSANGHTSRDTYLKWSAIKDKPFEIVIVYHGINDARMNCCRPGQFKDDYTHCAWYDQIERAIAAGGFQPADVVRDLIPVENASPDLLDYGGDLKTRAAFRRNIEQIAVDLEASGGLLLVMPFAHYIPADYTWDKLKAGELDYGPNRFLHVCPVETWGKPEHVNATLAAHNEEIRAIAAAHGNAVLLDLPAAVPAEGKHFSDPCHLTAEGLRLAQEAIVAAVEQALSQAE